MGTVPCDWENIGVGRGYALGGVGQKGPNHSSHIGV